MRVPILALDVNLSPERYGVERVEPPTAHGVLADPDDVILAIRLPLDEVPGITPLERADIRRGRPYADLAELVRRVQPSTALLSALGHAGALDTLLPGEPSRVTVMAAVRRHTATSLRARRAAAQQAFALFDIDEAEKTDAIESADVSTADVESADEPSSPVALPSDAAVSPSETTTPLVRLGNAIGHVIDDYRPLLDEIGAMRASDLSWQQSGSTVIVAGSRSTSRAIGRQGADRTIVMSIDDGTASFDAAFGGEARQLGTQLSGSRLVLVEGTVRDGDDGCPSSR